MHKIGTTVWFRGNECTVTGAPDADGFQAALDNETGRTVYVASPERVTARVERQQRDHAEMQAGFRRLRDLNK